ncbi:MAG: MOSC domain-containing protein, partial [Waterburya sp.]
RPNIVVETIEPFVEDTWSVIQIGEIRFTVVKPCSRCIITTIDQQQGAKNQLKEPLNTLGTFRQLSEQGVMFGVNMIPQNEGTIKVGDRLEVLQTRD